MRISGFTIVRNGAKLRYPFIQSITSILPICDEFVVNVGQSEDTTLDLVKSIGSPKIKIIETIWDMGRGPKVLSEQTNIALSHCTGDWAFYLQTDEVVHEADLPKLKRCMQKHLDDPWVDALRFQWLHFYGSHFRYRIDRGWYQKQDRIIRNDGTIESWGDAWGFRRKDGQALESVRTRCLLYHYGWVNSPEDMQSRCQNAAQIGYQDTQKTMTSAGYGDLSRFPVYFGTHPAVMKDLVDAHPTSRQDWQDIERRHWWNPLRMFRVRYKTGRRIRGKI